MTRPSWNDPTLKAGAMVKGALWLVDEVGEGQIFKKEALRHSFPGVSQIDRRIRDLRDYGWVIATNSEDATLLADEQRFVAKGLDVWVPSERRKADRSTVSNRARSEAMTAANHQCEKCGISGGERYPEDATRSAVLLVTKGSNGLLVLCRACSDGKSRSVHTNEARLRAEVQNLSDQDRAILRRWIHRGSRGPTPLDRVWTAIVFGPDELLPSVEELL